MVPRARDRHANLMDAAMNTVGMDLSDLQRTVVVGTTGSGKSAAAARLAAALGAPHVELDAINWRPNWIGLNETDIPLFRSQVEEAVRCDAWVVDGNYGVARDLIWPRATAVVWLDYPFGLVFWRLVRRTLRRSLRRETLWAGNRESISRSLSRDSILLWAFKTHWRRRRSLYRLFAEPEQAHLRLFHMRRPSDTEQWLRSIASSAVMEPSSAH